MRHTLAIGILALACCVAAVTIAMALMAVSRTDPERVIVVADAIPAFRPASTPSSEPTATPTPAPGPTPTPVPETTRTPQPRTATDRVDQDLLNRLAFESGSWSLGVEVSIAVVTATGEPLGVRANEITISASAAKAYWVAAAADMAGTEAVEPFAFDVLRWSDNNAAGRVVDLVGVDPINVWLARKAGLSDTELVTWSAGGRRASSTWPGPLHGENYTTTADAAAFMAALRRGELLDPEATATMTSWLQLSPRSRYDESTYGGILPDRLPPLLQAATLHKGGWLPPECCTTDTGLLVDMGLIPIGDDWVAIGLSAGGGADFEGGAAWMAYATCEIYAAVSDVTADCARPDDPI